MVRAVPFETPDTKYLVKVSVQMDEHIENFLDEDNDDPMPGDDIDEVAEEDLDD